MTPVTLEKAVCSWEAHVTKGLANPLLADRDTAQAYVNRLWRQHAQWYKPLHSYPPPIEIAKGDKLAKLKRDGLVAKACWNRMHHRIVIKADELLPLTCIHEVAHLLTNADHDERFMTAMRRLLASDYPERAYLFRPSMIALTTKE